MKKVAITGANGFVGSNLVRKLLKKGYQVKCLVRQGSNLSLLPPEADIHKIDYNNIEEIVNPIADCEYLIHNAALTRAPSRMIFDAVNVELTRKLLSAARKCEKIKRFVFISSQAAAGPATSAERFKREEDSCEPVSWYGESKLQAEIIIKKARIPYTIIRPVSVFGPGDRDFLQYFKLIRYHLAIYIGFKPKYISLVYVEDLVEMIIDSLENKKAENEILFAVSTPKISQQEFVGLIKEVMHSKVINLHLPHFVVDLAAIISDFFAFFSPKTPLLNRQKAREFKQRFWLADNRKMKSILNLTPQKDLRQQIEETYNWYKRQGWL